MKLVRLVVARLPGIAERLELLPAAGRVSVVVGPNASGKTSLIRALAALVQHSPDNRPVDIEAEFHDGEHRILGRAIGQARTWWRDGNEIARPDWPDADQLGAYLIRAEQLADAGATERQFSETLRQVMAGGYDLDALAGAAPFEKPARPRKLAGEYSDAGQRLQKLESGHAELAAEIDRLEALRSKHRESIEAQRRLQVRKRALELLDLERKLAATRQALNAFPEGIERLDGSEIERLERLDREMALCRQRLERTRESRAEAQQLLAESGITNIESLEAFATDLADLRQQLQAHERRLQERRQQCRDLKRARQTAARGVGRLTLENGKRAEDRIILDHDALDNLERLAARVRGTQTGVDGLERELAWRGRQTADRETLADLQSAIDALRAWLAVPPPTAVGWTVWSLLLASACGAAAWLALELDRPLHGAIAAAAGLMPLSQLVALAARTWRSAQQRARLAATALENPARWRRAEVNRRLQQLETHLAEQLRRQSEAERAAELGTELETARERLNSEWRQLKMAAKRLRIRPEWVLETTGQLRLHALLELRETEGQLERTRGALRDLERQQAELVEEIRATFEPAGCRAPAAIDADSIGHFLNRLGPKLGEARSARDTLENSSLRIRELEDELDKLIADRNTVLDEAGLEDPGLDDPGLDDDTNFGGAGEDADDAARRIILRDRLRQLKDWNRLSDELRGLESARRLALEALGEDPDLRDMARARDEAALLQLGEALAASAEQRDALAERIATIESEHKAALEQRELERLNTERERIRAELEQALEARRDAEAAQFLIERARTGFSRQHQPALFSRARNLFARMTHTRFELTFDGHSFGARDRTMAEQRSIAELSTATRIQLLLALRLAWIDEAERDGPGLPIFLDDVLATTDPERYRAVVEAVQELVRAGRQVIYLSSQPTDAQAWKHFAGEPAPKIIELAPITDESLAFELPEAVPSPDPELNAEDWAEQAGVARLDPWRGSEAVDLFHLSRDRLAALVALRNFGVITLGQFEHARELALELPIEDEAAKRLDKRGRAVHAWLQRWRRGHVPPVPARQLTQSGAVSPTFIERVIALNRDLGGNPAELVEALRNGAVSGFRRKKTDELEQELAAAGLLDRPQAAPTDAELIDTLARDGELDAEDAAKLHRWLQAALAGSSAV